MTEKELDAFMSKVLLDAIAFDEDRLEEKIPYAASARHRRQMRAMLKDPVRWTIVFYISLSKKARSSGIL